MACGVTLLEVAPGPLLNAVFVAVTVNVYDLPFVSPDTVSGLLEPVAVRPSGLEFATYLAIGEPPSPAGGLKLTIACPFPATAATFCGAVGFPTCGVTALEAADAGPAPRLLVACTVKV